MHDGIVQQIQKHLFDENRIHRDKQNLVRNLNLNRYGRTVLVKFLNRAADDFLGKLFGFGNVGIGTAADSGDRQNVLHNPVQPLGLCLDVTGQCFLLLIIQGVVIVQNGRGGPYNRSQRSADVMRDGTQKIRTHLLALHLKLDLLLLFDLCRQGTDDDGYGQHDEKGQWISGQREIKAEIGESKNTVDTENRNKGGNDAVAIAFRKAGNENNGQNENQRNICIRRYELLQNKTEDAGRQKNSAGHEAVLQNGMQIEVMQIKVLHIRNTWRTICPNRSMDGLFKS